MRLRVRVCFGLSFRVRIKVGLRLVLGFDLESGLVLGLKQSSCYC